MQLLNQYTKSECYLSEYISRFSSSFEVLQRFFFKVVMLADHVLDKETMLSLSDQSCERAQRNDK